MKYLNDISYKDCVGKVCKSTSSGDFKVLKYNNLTEVKNQYVYVLVDEDKSWYDSAQGIEHLTTNPNKQCGIKKMMFKDYFSSWEE